MKQDSMEAWCTALGELGQSQKSPILINDFTCSSWTIIKQKDFFLFFSVFFF